uniref:FYVE, RhoGEF and PH domain-containing protein 6-like isoform X1 n=1 Tax=Petromyzon marinus TaxID=7757 RepID=A0AAJ7X6X2_PETMA|nr:FYVE, RhoGEF and PH domain-containing protein 6-like isoform X1 [Petromyzon marinus]XP_032822294.1 FYVE, RhoGEF and PH domain-containing protein 6-like isoform X1 [Petromyzon marinus]
MEDGAPLRATVTGEPNRGETSVSAAPRVASKPPLAPKPQLSRPAVASELRQLASPDGNACVSSDSSSSNSSNNNNSSSRSSNSSRSSSSSSGGSHGDDGRGEPAGESAAAPVGRLSDDRPDIISTGHVTPCSCPAHDKRAPGELRMPEFVPHHGGPAQRSLSYSWPEGALTARSSLAMEEAASLCQARSRVRSLGPGMGCAGGGTGPRRARRLFFSHFHDGEGRGDLHLWELHLSHASATQRAVRAAEGADDDHNDDDDEHVDGDDGDDDDDDDDQEGSANVSDGFVEARQRADEASGEAASLEDASVAQGSGPHEETERVAPAPHSADETEAARPLDECASRSGREGADSEIATENTDSLAEQQAEEEEEDEEAAAARAPPTGGGQVAPQHSVVEASPLAKSQPSTASGQEDDHYCEVDFLVSLAAEESSDGLYSEIHGIKDWISSLSLSPERRGLLSRVKSLTGSSLFHRALADDSDTHSDTCSEGSFTGTPRSLSCGSRLVKERSCEQVARSRVGGGAPPPSAGSPRPWGGAPGGGGGQDPQHAPPRHGAAMSPLERRKRPEFSPPSPLAARGPRGGARAPPPWGSNPGASSVGDIPPPFELAPITKKPLAKSSPSILMTLEPQDNKHASKRASKKKSSLKRLLPFKISVRKKHAEQPKWPSEGAGLHARGAEADERRHKGPRASPGIQRVMALGARGSKEHGNNNSGGGGSSRHNYSGSSSSSRICRVESFESRPRPPHAPHPLTKPRSISFPNPSPCTEYENVPVANSDYENMTPPVRKSSKRFAAKASQPRGFFGDEAGARGSGGQSCRGVPRRDAEGRGSGERGSDTDGYVDMSNFPCLEARRAPSCSSSRSDATPGGRAGNYGADAPSEDDDDEDEEEEGGPGSRLHHHHHHHHPSAPRTAQTEEEKRSRAFEIAREIMRSEKSFVESIKLLHLEFRDAVAHAGHAQGWPVLEDRALGQILSYLPQLYALNRELLRDFVERVSRWEESPRIADVFVRKGPYLKLYSAYVREFDNNIAVLDESCRAVPAFAALVREFERRTCCGNLPLKHFLLKPVQRIPQYKWLLTDYLRHLSPESPDYADTQAAIAIISEVASHTNDCMRQGDNFQKLLQIQQSLQGSPEVVRPGRVFLKEGTLFKLCRKALQSRMFFLMNDALLYATAQPSGRVKLNSEICLGSLQASKPAVETLANELHFTTPEKTFILSASSPEERDAWLLIVSNAVEDFKRKRSTFRSVGQTAGEEGGEAREGKPGSPLGTQAPPWIPDARVPLCMICLSSFSLTWRRYHCRACGKIVCRACSAHKFPLKHLRDKPAKVCDPCYSSLHGASEIVSPSVPSPRPPERRHKDRPQHGPRKAAEPSAMSGPLERMRGGKKHWKCLWFVVRDRVLYTYRTSQDAAPCETLPLDELTVTVPVLPPAPHAAHPTFQLLQRGRAVFTFRAPDTDTAQRAAVETAGPRTWVEALQEEFL